jgi:hypothetical protein
VSSDKLGEMLALFSSYIGALNLGRHKGDALDELQRGID